MDGISIAYGLVLAIVIGALVGRISTGFALVLLNLGMGLVAVTVLPRLRARGGVGRFFGVTLPLLVFYVYYRETALVLSRPDIGWLDWLVAGAELRAWTSVAPGSKSPLLGEFFALAYMSYVPLLLVVAVALLRHAERGPKGQAESFVRQVCLAWGVCYILFLVVPVLGPRFALPGLQEPRMGAGPFSIVARLNQDHGMVRGAAFPSAHVAATAIAVFSVWRCRRSWFWWLLPIALALAIGAVYLGYHYVVDVLAGLCIGAVAIGIDRLMVGRRVLPGPRMPAREPWREERSLP